MEWSGQNEFVASSEVPFVVNGSEAGLLKSHGPLSFLKVALSYIPLYAHTRAHTRAHTHTHTHNTQ